MLSVEESIGGIHRMLEQMMVRMKEIVGGVQVVQLPPQNQEN